MSLTLAARLPCPSHQPKATTTVTSTASYKANGPCDRQVGLSVPLRLAGSEDLEGAPGVYNACLAPSLP